MWGNNASRLNNQNNSGANVNTRIKNFTSDVSSLVAAFWNQNFSLTISPAIGADGNGIMQYDQNRQGKTALTLDACEALVEQFKNEILPVYNKVVLEGDTCPETLSVTVETGRDPKRNVVGIEMTAPSDESNIPDMYFVYYGMVDVNNIASPANTFKHKFAKRFVRVDYNPNTGVSKKETYANAEFNMFLNMISKTELLLPFSEHVKKYNSERSKSFTSSNGNGNSSYSGGNNGYGNQSSGGMNFASSPSYNSAGYSMFGGALADSGAEELPFN